MIWRFAKTILTSGAVLVIVLLGVAAAVTKARDGQLLSVQTGSMTPALHKGDLVGVTSVPDETLRVGDVITYLSSDQRATITHRIIELPSTSHPDQVITKGDANPMPDQPVSTARIIGRQTWSVPFAGYAVDVVRKPIGLIAIIYVPALMIIINELKRLAAYYKSQQPYVAPGYRPHPKRASKLEHMQIGAGLTVLALGVVLVWSAVPAHAALQASAQLGGNTITATRP